MKPNLWTEIQSGDMIIFIKHKYSFDSVKPVYVLRIDLA